MKTSYFSVPALGNDKSTWRLAYQSVLSRPFVEYLHGLIQEDRWSDAVVGDTPQHDVEMRNCQQQPLPFSTEVFDELTMHIQRANQEIWRFDLQGIDLRRDPPQFVQYKPGGEYRWHIDHGVSVSTRKLSFVVPLVEPSLYEGGDLEIFPPLADEEQVSMKKVGNIILFPSYVPHRVTPVVFGVRRVLIGWIHGSSFR
ncbi:MAG: 2OG-Fe(II) oxygenase [Myxococcota bacterium]|nr:2OG-Fe(II) oxygenase [Myxococcota bacterium]